MIFGIFEFQASAQQAQHYKESVCLSLAGLGCLLALTLTKDQSN